MIISNEFLGWVSIIIGTIGYIPYFVSIFRGKTKPHILTWFVWGVLTSIAYFAQVSDGAGVGAWVTGFTALVSFFITILALFKGEKDITKSDCITFSVALISIPIWYFTKTPLYSVILITVIDALAFFPTFRKSYNKPHEELPILYILSALKFVVALIVLANWSIITALYPASLVLMNGVFVLMLLYR